jgi:mono/diheme cytochrome c family protein
VISDRGEAEGGTAGTRNVAISDDLEEGKELFRQACASCHNLDAVQARGIQGPDLDEIGEMTTERVAAAIENGGATGERMPSGLLRDEDAERVAEYVAAVAGR